MAKAVDDHSVYLAKDLKTGKPYVGRTNQTTKVRLEQHGYRNAPKELIKDLNGLTKAQSRGLEQELIEAIGKGNLSNAINGISPKNPKGEMYREAGKKFLDFFIDVIKKLKS